MTTLVIAAHPDDETLGCGGTISRLTAQGEQVHVAILCKTRVPSSHTERALAELLPIGSKIELVEFNQPDQKLDTIPLTKLARKIERLIAETNPRTVYTHHPGDLNLDHAITHRAVTTACRPVNDCPVRTIYAMEIPSSTEWGTGFHPNVYSDITDTLNVKLEAMRMYETESRESPHPRSPEMLRALAQIRGAAVGVHAAEAFQLIRQLHPTDALFGA